MIELVAFGFGGGFILFVAWALAPLWSASRKRLVRPEICRQDHCSLYRHAACGSGQCAYHCDLYCNDRCIDPRSAPIGNKDHKLRSVK